MKKEVEKKNSFIIDLSSSEPSSDGSEKELPIENTEELKKYLQTSEEDNDESTKKIPPKKTKKFVKKRKTSFDNSDDQDKPSKTIKKPKKPIQTDSQEKSPER